METETKVEAENKKFTNDTFNAACITIEMLQEIANRTSHEKGWYNPPKTDGECMLLFHSEIS